MANKLNKGLIRQLLKLFLSIGLLTLVFLKVEINELFNNLLTLPYYTIFILFIAASGQFMINVFRKNTMFQIFGYKENFWKLYKQIFKGSFYGFFLPSAVAGDAYHSIYFGKKFNNYTKIIGGLILNKIIGFIAFFIYLIFLLSISYNENLNLLFNFRIDYPGIENSYLYIIPLAILTIIIFLRKKIFNFLKKIKNELNNIFYDIKAKPKRLLYILMLSILFYTYSLFMKVILANIVGINLSGGLIALIILIVNFLALIPISISGIGVREVSYVALFGLINVDKELAITFSLLNLGIHISGLIIGGSIILHEKANNTKMYLKKNKN